MALDAYKNFSYSNVATAPSPASSGTSLVVTAGHGSRFPAVSFNAVVWPANTTPTPANAEIVRVTAISTDTFTITRTQEGTSARSIVVGDQIAFVITKKWLDDLLTTSSRVVTAQSTPADPTGTASATDVMMGLAGSITPTTTKIMIVVSGTLSNNATAVRTGTAQIRHGTGTAPTNGAAATGTADGAKISVALSTVAANQNVPFSLQAIVTGLTAGTAYWIDLAVSSSSNTTTPHTISISAYDLI